MSLSSVLMILPQSLVVARLLGGKCQRVLELGERHLRVRRDAFLRLDAYDPAKPHKPGREGGAESPRGNGASEGYCMVVYRVVEPQVSIPSLRLAIACSLHEKRQKTWCLVTM